MARNFAAHVQFTEANGLATTPVIPAAQRPGTLHVILELRDNGPPELWSCRWIVTIVSDESRFFG